MKWLRTEGVEKPLGWSFHFAHVNRQGFKLGMFGGTLYIPEFDFREWFFRIPLMSQGIIVTYRGA